MGRTFISQPNQIFSSENYTDALTPGVGLQTGSITLENDLNAIRTQIRQILWANVSGSWHNTISAPSGSNSARGLNTINLDLSDLEQKRFLFRRQNLNLVNIATGSNFALLSVSLGTAPTNFAVVGHPLLVETLLTGTLVAALSGSEGTYGSHSLAQISGSSVITPKNLVLVRDAWTGQQITGSNGRDVFGLLQVESGVTSGQSFNDSTRRTQISLIVESITNGTSSLIAAPSEVGGKTITYNYVYRLALDDLPEDSYINNVNFTDLAESTKSESLTNHDSLRRLVHLADGGGPFEGFSSGAVFDQSTGPFPTLGTWYTSSARTNKIIDQTITYNSNKLVTSVQWRAYADDGVTISATVVDTITYDGIYEISRTRTIT